MNWWRWDTIGREWIPCEYCFISPAVMCSIALLLGDAIEEWLAHA